MNYKSLFKKTASVYFLTYLAAPLAYLVKILYARSFDLVEFGLIYSIIGFISIISIFNDFGLTETLNYYGARFYEKKEYSKIKGALIFATLTQTITGIIILLALLFLSPYLAANYFKNAGAEILLRWFLVYFLFLNISKPFIQLFPATQNYHYAPLSDIIRHLLTLVLSVIAITFLKEIKFIGIAWGMAYFLLFVCYLKLSLLKFPEIYSAKADLSFSLYNKLLRYAIIIVISSGTFLLLSRIDIVFLTYFRSLEEVALYSVAFSLSSIIYTLTHPITGIIFPLTSKLSISENWEHITNLIRGMYNLGLFLSLPLLVMFISFPVEVISLLFGYKYAAAKTCLIILSFSYFITTLNMFNFQIISGIGMVKKRAKIMYIGTAVNVIANYLLIPQMGIIGAAWGTLLSILTLFILSYFSLNSHFELNLRKKSILKIIVLNIGVFFMVFYLKKIINLNIFVEGSIIIFVVGLIYLLIGHYWNIVNFKIIFNILKNEETSYGDQK